jgi:hypothetical protein
MLKTSPAIEPCAGLGSCAKQQGNVRNAKKNPSAFARLAQKPATAMLTSRQYEKPTKLSVLVASKDVIPFTTSLSCSADKSARLLPMFSRDSLGSAGAQSKANTAS